MSWIKKISEAGNTMHIKKNTNTLFRQHERLSIYFSMAGKNWKDERTDRDALVIFTRKQQGLGATYLVVIPKKIVDDYIFNPIFKNTGNGYIFKPEYSHYNYSKNRINLILDKESSNISLRSKSDSGAETIELFNLPEGIYWFPIDLSSVVDPVMELILRINETVKKVEDGKGIRVINQL